MPSGDTRKVSSWKPIAVAIATPILIGIIAFALLHIDTALQDSGILSSENAATVRGGIVGFIFIIALWAGSSAGSRLVRADIFPVPSKALDRLSKAKTGDVQEIAAAQIELLEAFYRDVLTQARQSFRSALIAAITGLAFFLVALAFLIVTSSPNLAYVNVISGAVIEAIAGLNFWLYGQATEQLAVYHQRLDATQRLLLANAVCESLEGELKQTTRADLVRVIASIKQPAPPIRRRIGRKVG